MEQPKRILGTKINEQSYLEALARVKARENPNEKPETQTTIQINPNEIYIPEIKLYFQGERTHLNLNWDDTHKALKKENLRMPTLIEFATFLKHLNSDQKYQQLFKEITEVREPWRSNWIDAYFEKRKDGMYILTRNKTQEEKISDYITQDKTPGINLESWINNPNPQGLPRQNTSSGNLYYWTPEDKRVARFYALSGRAYLDCGRYPSDSADSLGVYACREATRS